jgi:hypothetical protein
LLSCPAAGRPLHLEGEAAGPLRADGLNLLVRLSLFPKPGHPEGYPGPGSLCAALAAIRATPARHGFEDLDLFAGTGVLDKMANVDDTLVAGVGALEAGVVRLYGVVVLGRWVRGMRGRLIHVNSSILLAGSRGVRAPAGPSLYPTHIFYLYITHLQPFYGTISGNGHEG